MNRNKIVFLKPRYKSFYLLPNILTTVALCFGFLSIISSINGSYDLTVKYLLFSLVADGLDGRVARLTNTQTEFGKQYDSLSDLVAFGVSPAIFLVMLTNDYLHHVSWAAAFCYLSLTAIRLARFNTQSSSSSFQGLPSPSAAIFLVLTMYGLHSDLSFVSANGLVLVAFLLGILMVTTVAYPGFKNISFNNQQSKLWLICIVCLCAVIVIQPYLVIWSLLLGFILYGPLLLLYKLWLNRRQ